MRKREEVVITSTLTAMIDVVFQLIIFFVCTVSMQDKAIDDTIRLADAPHGIAVEKKNPYEVNIDVNQSGRMTLNHLPLTQNELAAILQKMTGEVGPDNVPVIIRGDSRTKHDAIRPAMDACVMAGIYKIKFAAMKERGG
jgi:biopolymer transport protein ExbD